MPEKKQNYLRLQSITDLSLNQLLIVFSLTLFFLLGIHGCTKTNNKNQLRLAYMPNVTHAVPLIGIEKNIFQNELGKDIQLKPIHFVVGNSIIDAFITGQIDIAYIGPGPFINAIYRKIPIELLSNAANGGSLIVGSVNNLALKEGDRISVPQYGNTQDLILRAYLQKNNLAEKVMILAIPPQDTGTAFFTMSIDAACLPEPWGTILIDKKIVKLLVNKNDLFNNGNYPVTILLANKNYVKNNSETINKFLSAHKKTIDYISGHPKESTEAVKEAISNISKKQIDISIIAKSFANCDFKDKIDLKIISEFKAIGIRAGYYRKGFEDENSYN